MKTNKLNEIKKEDLYTEEYYTRILNKNRYLILYNEINESSADFIITKLRAMDMIDHNTPIYFEINSPGGSVEDGMGIINAIKSIQAPVYTVVSGNACSMAALISIVGTKRYIYPNSYWMQHPLSTMVGDYTSFIKDHMKFIEEYEQLMLDIFKQHTKLTSEDLIKLQNGELWLNAERALEKGVVDEILPYKK